MPTDAQTVQAYNENAETYNKHVLDPNDSIYHAYYEKPAMRAELPDLGSLSVLSIGCGSGVDAHWLSQNGAKDVTGIDISDGLIKIARKSYPNISFDVMDMEDLKFADESFDLLYSSLAIHYLDDWLRALKEAYRVLKPKGEYIFSCSHPIDTALERKSEGVASSSLLGRVKNKEGEKIVYGDYLCVENNGIKPVDGVLGAFSVRIYHHPIGKTIEQVRTAGFNVKRIIEPLPTLEMKKVNPDIYRQLNRIPEFIIWVLEKET